MNVMTQLVADRRVFPAYAGMIRPGLEGPRGRENVFPAYAGMIRTTPEWSARRDGVFPAYAGMIRSSDRGPRLRMIRYQWMRVPRLRGDDPRSG